MLSLEGFRAGAGSRGWREGRDVLLFGVLASRWSVERGFGCNRTVSSSFGRIRRLFSREVFSLGYTDFLEGLFL